MTWTKELDEASVLATRSGCWHIVLFYLLCGLAAIPTSFLVFSQVFTNATPEHWCAAQTELINLGFSEHDLKPLMVPRKLEVFDSCHAYYIKDVDLLVAKLKEEIEYNRGAGGGNPVEKLDQNKSNIILSLRSNETTACRNGWYYSKEHYESTLVTQFSLVCDNDWLPRTSNTLFWVGSIFGNLFFGWMSDRYGRRPTILLMILLEVPLAIAVAFPGSYWTYIVLRVVSGLFFPALYQLPYVLALELMPPLRRTYTGIVVSMLFASGMCLLALLAFLVKDWFYLSLSTTMPFILLYGYYWLIPESPRWLVSRGRIADAEKVFRNMARKNSIELRRGFLLDIHKRIKDEQEAEVTMLCNLNGHIIGYQDQFPRDDYMDRRISNMLTFNPDNNIITETDESKTENLERIIALEVADIVNKKAKAKTRRDSAKDDEIRNETEESLFNTGLNEKSTQTDSFTKSPASTLRRKSMQIVNKIFAKDYQDDEIMENKKMDDENSEGDCKASPLDIFRYPNIRKKFLILTFNWVALGVVYNSLSYNTPNLGVDDYLAFFIGGAVELPSYVISWRCMDKFGRRWVLFIFMLIGGLACLSCAFVPESMPWVTVSLSMLGRFFIAAAFAVFYVQIGELLPTVLRSQAMGASSFIAGLGLLACPYIVHLSVYSKSLPLTIMGIFSLAGGITSLFLPETLNQPLPQTLGDGEIFGRNFKILSCVQPTKV
ncbi:beta-alanine transporter-like [Plodia interpunctella]|uniref:beta-alanine transporter-like n=1 Tax=Plodia interpunctella TaxID=58824 RepID=UPI0023683363|nr:beta-alanine transporter-like [Plodia interpunctella]XP_053618235.1 beta-alanine transporter-like [Plodia interpunctella]